MHLGALKIVNNLNPISGKEYSKLNCHPFAGMYTSGSFLPLMGNSNSFWDSDSKLRERVLCRPHTSMPLPLIPCDCQDSHSAAQTPLIESANTSGENQPTYLRFCASVAIVHCCLLSHVFRQIFLNVFKISAFLDVLIRRSGPNYLLYHNYK